MRFRTSFLLFLPLSRMYHETKEQEEGVEELGIQEEPESEVDLPRSFRVMFRSPSSRPRQRKAIPELSRFRFSVSHDEDMRSILVMSCQFLLMIIMSGIGLRMYDKDWKCSLPSRDCSVRHRFLTTVTDCRFLEHGVELSVFLPSMVTMFISLALSVMALLVFLKRHHENRWLVAFGLLVLLVINQSIKMELIEIEISNFEEDSQICNELVAFDKGELRSISICQVGSCVIVMLWCVLSEISGLLSGESEAHYKQERNRVREMQERREEDV